MIGIGAGIGIARPRGQDLAAAIRAALFGAGEVGVMYDPSDFSTMYQDAGGTTPVTAAGDPVALVNDKSGNGINLACAYVTLAVDRNGNYYLQTNSTTSTLIATGLDLTANFLIVYGFKDDTVPLTGNQAGVYEFIRSGGTIGTAGDSVLQTYFNTADNKTTKRIWQRYPAAVGKEELLVHPYSGNRFVGYETNNAALIYGDYFPGSAKSSTNDGAVAFVAHSGGTLNLMRGYQGTRAKGRLYGFLMVMDTSTTDEVSAAIEWMNTKTGTALTPDYYITPGTCALIESTATYDGFGFGVQCTNGNYLYVGRRGTSHVGDNGELRSWTWNGSVWSQATIVNTAYDERNAAGGIDSAGTVHVLYAEYDTVGTAFFSMKAIKSTDHGATWSSPVSVSTEGTTSFSPYGPLVELPSGKLMQTIYGWSGTTYKVWATFSSDSGATWGNEVVIYSATTSPALTELSAAYISGSTDATAKIVAVSRDNAGAMSQLVSADGGATWTNQGVLPFSSGTNVDVTPWLYLDGTTLHLVYADRTAGFLRHYWGDAASIYADKTAWGEPDNLQAKMAASAIDFGYPSFFKDASSALVMFYNDRSTSAAPDIWSNVA